MAVREAAAIVSVVAAMVRMRVVGVMVVLVVVMGRK
jgi:hypothetical protein